MARSRNDRLARQSEREEPGNRTSQPVRTVIRSATLLTMTPSQRAPFEADIAIEGTRIKEIGPGLDVSDADRVVEARGMLAMPGLINAHMHSSEAFFKGRYDRLAFDAWGLFAYPLLDPAPVSPELIHLRTLFAGMEALKSGVTFVVDDIADEISGQGLDGLAAAFRAYRDLGIRATCSGNVMNRHALETLPKVGTAPPEVAKILALPLPSVNDYLAFCDSAYEAFHESDSRLRFMTAPVAPQWCSDEMLVAAHDFATRHGLQFHTHVLETKVQALIARDHFGGSLIGHMESLGVLSSNTNLIHMVWATPEEIATVAEHGASVIHNPHSNLKLGSGIAPFCRYLHAKVAVGLGTDGLASNDTARLFDVIRLTALLHRLTDPDPGAWPSAYDSVYAATIGGAQTALMSDEVGTLEPGKRADLILLDMSSGNLTPLNDAYGHLAFCEDGGSVKSVMVDGVFVVEDGAITTLDEEAVMDEIRTRVPAYLAAHEGVEKRHTGLEAYMTAIDIAASREFDQWRGPAPIRT